MFHYLTAGNISLDHSINVYILDCGYLAISNSHCSLCSM